MLDSFLATARPRIIPVDVDHARYYIRPLSGAGRVAYTKAVKEDWFGLGVVVLFGLCTEDGTLLGDPFNEADRTRIDQADGGILQQLANRILEESGLVEKAADKAEKKSDPSQSESSGTG